MLGKNNINYLQRIVYKSNSELYNPQRKPFSIAWFKTYRIAIKMHYKPARIFKSIFVVPKKIQSALMFNDGCGTHKRKHIKDS